MTTANIIEIFCILDEFCKYFEPELQKHTLSVSGRRHRNRPGRMSDSEIMTILVLFYDNEELEKLCDAIRKWADD